MNINRNIPLMYQFDRFVYKKQDKMTLFSNIHKLWMVSVSFQLFGFLVLFEHIFIFDFNILICQEYVNIYLGTYSISLINNIIFLGVNNKFDG